MGLGINVTQNITYEDIERVINVTNLPELAINVNTFIYDGYFFLIMLFIAWVILFLTAQLNKDQVLNNLMYSGAVISVASILLRAVYVVRDGLWQGLLTDAQMWIFPILTVAIATIVWMTKD